jgi:hypothetical protein
VPRRGREGRRAGAERVFVPRRGKKMKKLDTRV